MNENYSKSVGKRLKETRKAADLKQSDVAEKAKLSTNYYARLERGEVAPSITVMKSVAEALGLKPGDLLN